ncbi:MlaD family protein [Gordonia sp. L191]|uniref:MlaD family protein n=1 Tax=Gordonia sp. L191 TaxID=2982699 RepID=UPI0024BFA9D7|nr:MlaD family protein [Gordonia sp. L191]WHU47415.1 MlaD family protein [Gordonia sp. L191]
MSQLRRFRERLAENDLLAGLIAVLVIAAVVAGVAYYYLSPPGRQEISFTTRDASSVAGGEDVRVAGVSVGKVERVSLGDKNVQVTLDVDSKVHIGDATRVKVQLLTAVGGYFVSLIPGGKVTDDSSTIAADRVSVPYTIADTLQELPRITDNVNGKPIDQSLQQVADGLSQANPSIRNAIDGLQTLSTVMDDQKVQVRSILDMANEYLTTFDNSRDFVFELVRKVNIALSQYYTYRAGFSQAYKGLGGVLERVGVLAQFYLNHTDQVYPAVVAARDTLRRLNDTTSGFINQLVPLRDQLMRLIGPANAADQNAGFVLDATSMCLPVPGRAC